MKNNEYIVRIKNVSKEDARRLNGLFKTMEYLGGIGASRTVNFFCDGDGSFRPKIKMTEARDGYEASVGTAINRYISYNEDDPTLT